MTITPPSTGQPVCGVCGYDLTGCTESSKCPECGTPLVECLMRGGVWGKRYRSNATIFGLPIVDVAYGPSPGSRIGRAKGILAFGDQATGLLAIGGQARGLVAIGGMAIGGFTCGGMSFGLFSAAGGIAIGGMAWGGLAAGVIASGGVAAGYIATGGLALGYYAVGGMPIAVNPAGPGVSSQSAIDAITRFSWFFGPPRWGVMTMLQPLLATLLAMLAAATGVGLFALIGHRMSGEDESGTV